jgi:hypothetical protein
MSFASLRLAAQATGEPSEPLRWTEAPHHAEDTIRFYALRMREARCIQSSLQKIIVDGTDWHFLADDQKVRDDVLRPSMNRTQDLQSRAGQVRTRLAAGGGSLLRTRL